MYDLILCAGQSNMEGCGSGSAERPYQPDERIWITDIFPDKEGDYRLHIAQDNRTAHLGLFFARAYAAAGLLAPGRKLLLLNAAVGGTGFRDKRWRPGDDLEQNMHRMLRWALALADGAELRAFLWHQGETDAMLGADAAEYVRNLTTLVAGVRAACNTPTLPFLCADFVQQWTQDNREVTAPVLAALRESVSALGHAAHVTTEGLLSNDQDHGDGDTIHFCRQGLALLGERYFEAYRSVTA
ncbi:MAG: sialate O-acetylesterase [Oscillospiraceae bacterium]|jgi:hypothetical protein|nr:sialate O-acetylesterase [Oscillospiraceae bacterium]